MLTYPLCVTINNNDKFLVLSICEFVNMCIYEN